jgi:hypothetical protein
VKLILWTSSHRPVIDNALEFLRKKGIFFDYVNENPDIDNDKLCDFSDKFYFDVLLDDKAGFYPARDWPIINQILKEIFQAGYHESN